MRSKSFSACFRIVLALTAGLISSSHVVLAQTPTVVPNRSTYLTGEPITVNFQGGPGNRLDWIGIYPDGVVPGTQNSTDWWYVDGTRAGSTGLSEGSVTFTAGLNTPGDWAIFFLLNDDYTVLAQTKIRVVDGSGAFLRASKAVYTVGDTVSIAFTNGPGNPKDWIGLYSTNVAVPDNSYKDYKYVNNTQTSTTGLTEGVVTFTGVQPGAYRAFLLVDDGYSYVADETFTVVSPSAANPRVLAISPAADTTNASPFIYFTAQITNGNTKLATNSVVLRIDDLVVPHQLQAQGELATVSFTRPSPLPQLSTHTYQLTFSDNASTPKSFTNQASFTVIAYTNINLPPAIYLQTFDSVPEGQLPAGWTNQSFTTVNDLNLDLQDLNSASYAAWLVVNRERFTSNFLTYDSHTGTDDYRRVLTVNHANVVNGLPITNLASGRILFNTSGYRSGGVQYSVVYTSDFDLSAHTNVYLSFHSLWEQNQDSIAALEYSTNQGSTWLPAMYLIDQRNVVLDVDNNIDVAATMGTPVGGLPMFDDNGESKGGFYGAYIGAEATQALAPFISGRQDDGAVQGKRVEYIRLASADKQPKVRFRIAHAGTDSWYWGIDNFGLYSVGAPRPTLTVARNGAQLTIAWGAEFTGYALESASALGGTWTPVNGVVNNSVQVPIGTGNQFFRLRK